MSRISGRAYEQTIKYSPSATWEELRENLVQKFAIARDVQLIQNDNFQLTQRNREEVLSFGTGAERLLSELIKASMLKVEDAAKASIRVWNEETVATKFVQGLHENIRTMVRTACASTLHNVVRLAVEEEKIVQLQNKSTTQNNPRYCQQCNSNTHNSGDCRRRRYPLNNYNANPPPNSGSTPQAQQNYRGQIPNFYPIQFIVRCVVTTKLTLLIF